MASSYDMKKGEVYYCQWCNFELKILNTGEDMGLSEDTIDCTIDDGFSTLMCCGEELRKKQA